MPNQGLLARIGLIGLEPIEPVILAALITADPLLLIGPHGTGKSYLLNRLAEALGLVCRHYNASLLNYDDLVGYPLPNNRGGLEFVQTPASIWGAESVFLDEISRCRPDMQNKLFPIIHERRVQGLLLEKLLYRWAAMNPPRRDDDDGIGYAGSEPLDMALADRFAFVVEVPSWSAFDQQQQEAVILATEEPIPINVASALRAELDAGRALLQAIRPTVSRQLAAYVRLVTALLARGDTELSPRRAGMLLQNTLAVHAARLAGCADASLKESCLLALTHSLPQRAYGQKIDALKLLTAHREAWKAAQVDSADPRLMLLLEADPVRRVVQAMRIAALPETEFSVIAADALAASPAGVRHALALALFESGAAGRLVAAVADQCAQYASLVATPQEVREALHGGSTRHQVWKRILSVLGRSKGDMREAQLKDNLLFGLFSGGELATEADVDAALTGWERTRVTLVASTPAAERRAS